MKVVIAAENNFQLKPITLQRWAELEGIEVIFYSLDDDYKWKQVTLEEAEKEYFYCMIKDPNSLCSKEYLTVEEAIQYSDLIEEHTFPQNYNDRSNLHLIQAIEEIGVDEAGISKLKILDIPDDVDWELCYGYFGEEFIGEKRRIWM